MTDSAATTRISLEEIATKYLGALQKNHDMLSYFLSGSRKTTEADYDEFSNQLQVMPRQTDRMDFENAKRATQQWVLRNTLSDSLALVMPLLEDARTVCALCDFKASGSTDQAELQKIANQNRAEFLQKPLAEKFTHLKDTYGIDCEVSEHILILMDICKALMTKNGILTEEEAVDGKRTLKIRSVQIVQTPSTDGSGQNLSLSRKVGDSSREIKVGEEIHFTKAEQVGSILTVGVFISDMLKGIQVYAQKTGVAN
ncbi:hypothetical protein P0Y35_11470 [Kiritimatiellaeota bacterium B1221]|nr:hypothetical protein [Kiritimatiellaeota bacterium B1221]